ncbi:hypothetical protein D9619_011276 [Psilocybe cf. subviscida]|uniref:Chromo domain-containing protein n=1 Tax=Psilocybe cf. subviscida TaxID=2480587 RepID=A0A8H5BJ40_9AGAR|nr:hypothetical protein D9619_011276 [Psilocybe cf. subviscida]
MTPNKYSPRKKSALAAPNVLESNFEHICGLPIASDDVWACLVAAPSAHFLSRPSTTLIPPPALIHGTHGTEDEFNRPLPNVTKVTLHVRGDNWKPIKITEAKMTNGRLEFLTTWELPEGKTHELWELSSRMENDAPELIKKFYRDHPHAPRQVISATLEPGRNTTGIDYSLPSERELLSWSRKAGIHEPKTRFKGEEKFPCSNCLSHPKRLCYRHAASHPSLQIHDQPQGRLALTTPNASPPPAGPSQNNTMGNVPN